MKKAALYIRVSTQEQAQEGYSIGEQKERLIAYCKAHDWSIADVYVDGGYSGSNLKRPAIQKLINETSKFNVVLVYKLDRLSRSQRDTLYLIEEIFIPNKVDFVSMQESFDTSSPFGKAMIGLLAVFAQLEREQIKERTQMGRLARAKQGLFHGSGVIPIGYNYQDGKLVINPYEAEQVKKIFSLFLKGESVFSILKTMYNEGYNTKHGQYIRHSRITRMLHNSTYIGRIHFKDVCVENAHEAIISKEDFENVQKILAVKQRHQNSGGFKSKHLLTGMVFCAKCGGRYVKIVTTSKKGDVYLYYMCYSRAQKLQSMVKDPDCKNKNWRAEELESIVKNRVRELITNPQILQDFLTLKNKQPELITKNTDNIRIESRLQEIDRQISKLMDLYQVDGIPAEVLGSKINALYHEKTTLEATLDTEVKPHAKNLDLFKEMIADAAQIWDCSDDAQKRRILQSLINRIVLDDKRVEIEWAI